jgi:DNA-binding NarL/FixJ family response regulator
MKDQLRSIKLLLVDDHQLMVDGLKTLLRHEDSVYICGHANNGEEALEMLEYLDVDVLITDINMPVMNGIELTRQLKFRHPLVQVLALTMYQDSAFVKEILEAGASGYVLKNTGKRELLEAIHQLAANSTYFDIEIANNIFENLVEEKTAQNSHEELVVHLTDREQAILELLIRKQTHAQIGEKLFLQPQTVSVHCKNIYRKTNTKNLAALVAFSEQNRLINQGLS